MFLRLDTPGRDRVISAALQVARLQYTGSYRWQDTEADEELGAAVIEFTKEIEEYNQEDHHE